MSIREEITAQMKAAMKEKDQVALATIRLISAALKDRDLTARGKGQMDGISDTDILAMLQTMVKQRVESASTYRGAGRDELAEREEAEIKVIQTFLPQQLEGEAMEAAIDDAIAKCGAESIKDMGKVMGVLKSEYAGQIDMGKAGGAVKAKLG